MTDMPSIHEPVLLNEVLAYLNPQPGRNYIDGTFGGGGHSLALLTKIKPDGKVLGFDWDPGAVKTSKKGNLILVNDNYKNLKEAAKKFQAAGEIGEISGVLLDLGLSSDQLADEERGFGFESTEPMDMRFNPAEGGPKAAELIMNASEAELARIFTDFGEEPLAKQIAKAIVAHRQKGEDLQSAAMLVRLIADIYRRKFRVPSRKNPATRVMQALRIAVNDEFGNIAAALPKAIDVLTVGGRLAVISFHSGEDRLVKNYFRQMATTDYPRIKLVTKKPIEGTEAEIKANSRARSAKLRVIERIR